MGCNCNQTGNSNCNCSSGGCIKGGNWLIPVTTIPPVELASRRNAYILPDNSIYILNHDGNEMIPLGSGTSCSIEWDNEALPPVDEASPCIIYLQNGVPYILNEDGSDFQKLFNEEIIGEAPMDSQEYVRKDGEWEAVNIIDEAPLDGGTYGRNAGEWVVINGYPVTFYEYSATAGVNKTWTYNPTTSVISITDDSIDLSLNFKGLYVLENQNLSLGTSETAVNMSINGGSNRPVMLPYTGVSDNMHVSDFDQTISIREIIIQESISNGLSNPYVINIVKRANIINSNNATIASNPSGLATAAQVTGAINQNRSQVVSGDPTKISVTSTTNSWGGVTYTINLVD